MAKRSSEAKRRGRRERTRDIGERIKRALKVALTVVLLAVPTLVLALLLCLNTPPVRAFVVARVNGVLAKTFAGRIELYRVGWVDLAGVRDADARVFDPDGARVIDAHGLSARLNVPHLLWTLLVQRPDPLVVRIEHAGIRHAEVVLRDDGTGTPSLVSSFQPRKATAPSGPPGPPGRQVILVIEDMELEYAWVRGKLGGVPTLDCDVTRLAGSFQEDPAATLVRVDDAKIKSRGLPLGLDPNGHVSGRLRLAKVSAHSVDASLVFRGELAQTPAHAEFEALRSSLYATLTVGPMQPATLTRLAPGLSPKSPVSFWAEARGELLDLSFDARLDGRAGVARLTGQVSLSEEKSLRSRIVAERLDVSELIAASPTTELELVAETSLTIPEHGGPIGSYSIDLAPSKVAGTALPPVATTGTLEQDPTSGALRTRGHALIWEPGAATDLDFAFDMGKRPKVDLRASTALDNPERLHGALGLKAVGTLQIEAHHELGTGTAEAEARLTVRQLERSPFLVRGLTATARVSGKLRSPTITANAHTGQASISGRTFVSTNFVARGPPERLFVAGTLMGSDATRVDLATTVAIGQGDVTLVGSRVALTRTQATVRAEAPTVRIGPRGIQIERLALTGAGRAELSMTLGKRLERLDVTTQDLDLAVLARLIDPRLPLRRGRATLEGHFAELPEPSLSVRGKVYDVYAGKLSDASLQADLSVQSGRASGSLWARLSRGGDIVATVDEVGPIRAPLSRATLAELVGRMALQGDLDLSYLAPLVPAAILPAERAGGRVVLDVQVDRASASSILPNLTAHVRTRRLELVGKRLGAESAANKPQKRQSQPWALRQVDLDADVRVDGESGNVSFAARASDPKGELVAASLTTVLDPSLVRAPSSWSRAIWTSAFDARIRIPKRQVSALPALVRLPNTMGLIALELEASGTLRDPTLSFSAGMGAYRSMDAGEDKDAVPLNVRINGEHTAGRGSLNAEALSGDRRVATLTTQWRGQPASLVSGEGVSLGGHLRLDKFPLASLPMLRARAIGGTASGDVRLQGLGENAALEARLSSDTLNVGDAQLDSVFASVRARDGSLQMRAKILEPKGSAEIGVDSAMSWGNRLTPALAAPAHATVVARNFRLAALSPLVESIGSELEGRLDANMRADFDTETPKFEGSAEVRDGAINIGLLGQRFHAIAARLMLRSGELRVDRFQAKGSSGRLEGTGVAHFEGLDLRRAEAHVRIPRGSKVPLTLEGVSYGDAWGRVDLALTNPETGPIHNVVDVPELHVELPRSVGGHVQDLDPADRIKIGMQRANATFLLLPLKPLEEERSGPRRPMQFDIQLGKNVWIRKGTQVSVQLTGNTSITLDARTSVEGQIRLTGGTLDVSGKRFEIDRGTITFDGDDPANPSIFATARWDAPDGEYRVYAEYVGRAKNGKLVLRSEPSLSEDQILSLILFGSAEGHFGTSEEAAESQSQAESAAATAIGVAGGVATQGLTRALSDITELDVSARIDTSSGVSRPEIMVQISPRVAAKVSYSVGEPSAGQSPDRTFFSLEFRLKGNLGISTTVGDKGASSIELVWRRRY